jgi:putative endonuclease
VSRNENSTRAKGLAAESFVARTLEDEGWIVLARNWYGGGAEIDLVVQRWGALRIVEVKERGPEDPFGLEAVHRGKQRHLVQAATAFLAEHQEPYDEVCFLVALVEGEGEDRRITFVDNAFDA